MFHVLTSMLGKDQNISYSSLVFLIIPYCESTRKTRLLEKFFHLPLNVILYRLYAKSQVEDSAQWRRNTSFGNSCVHSLNIKL